MLTVYSGHLAIQVTWIFRSPCYSDHFHRVPSMTLVDFSIIVHPLLSQSDSVFPVQRIHHR